MTFLFLIELDWCPGSCDACAVEAFAVVMSVFLLVSNPAELMLLALPETLSAAQRILPLPIIEDRVSTGVANTPCP